MQSINNLNFFHHNWNTVVQNFCYSQAEANQDLDADLLAQETERNMLLSEEEEGATDGNR